MANSAKFGRRKAMKRVGSTGVALVSLSTTTSAMGSPSKTPDGPSTEDNTPPGGGGGAAETDANATSETVNISGCNSYQSRVSIGVHYYGSTSAPSGGEWLHEFCISGSSYAREEPLQCGGLEDLHTIDYQKFRVEPNNSGDTILSAQSPDPVYRGVTPAPANSSTSSPAYSNTVETILKTAISYQFPNAAYAMTAADVASSVYNDLLRDADDNDTDPSGVEKKWSYTGSSNPDYPPADANNYYRFFVSSTNSYYIDVTAEQEADVPTNGGGSLSTSLRFSNDSSSSSSADDGTTLTKGMSMAEVVSKFPSERVDRTKLSDRSPIKQRFETGDLVRVNLPLKFEDPEE